MYGISLSSFGYILKMQAFFDSMLISLCHHKWNLGVDNKNNNPLYSDDLTLTVEKRPPPIFMLVFSDQMVLLPPHSHWHTHTHSHMNTEVDLWLGTLLTTVFASTLVFSEHFVNSYHCLSNNYFWFLHTMFCICTSVSKSCVLYVPISCKGLCNHQRVQPSNFEMRPFEKWHNYASKITFSNVPNFWKVDGVF